MEKGKKMMRMQKFMKMKIKYLMERFKKIL